MNGDLDDLYKYNWKNICSALLPILANDNCLIKPTNPLLITFDDEEKVMAADFRVMIFGQETNDWYGEYREDLQAILECYDSFFNGGNCWSYGGQFWNGVGRFLFMMQQQFPNKRIAPIWNNIVKIGKHDDKGFPPDYIYKKERYHFSVIQQEIEIIKPNVVLFLTGPNYDSVIADNFGSLKYSPLPTFSERWLSRIELPGVSHAFRTYHPNFLWRNNIDNFFEKILKEIHFN